MALTFHRLYLEARVAGIQDVREHVTRAWRACYGTELQPWRYNYYVHHPDHAAVRVQCLNEIVDDGLERLLREDPRLNLQVLMNFAKGMIHEVLHDDRYLEISGCTVLHLQTPEGVKEERILHRSPPAKLVAAFLKLIVEAVKAQVTLHVIASGAVGQAARAQGVAPSRVFAGLGDPRIGKARPHPPSPAAPSPSAVPTVRDDLATLGIGPEHAISYSDHVRQMLAPYNDTVLAERRASEESSDGSDADPSGR